MHKETHSNNVNNNMNLLFLLLTPSLPALCKKQKTVFLLTYLLSTCVVFSIQVIQVFSSAQNSVRVGFRVRVVLIYAVLIIFAILKQQNE